MGELGMMKNILVKRISFPGRERGTTLVITLMVILVLMVIGAAALMTSSIELRVTGNERVQKQAFYAAEAGLNYARMNPPKLWTDMNNLNVAENFQNNRTVSGNDLRFQGTITYIGMTNIPIGGESGTKYKAFHYRLISNGQADNQAQAQAEMQGYVIGLAP